VARPARNKLESCMLTVFVECVWVDDLANKSEKKTVVRLAVVVVRESVYVVVRE